jgi:hypothetical protein
MQRRIVLLHGRPDLHDPVVGVCETPYTWQNCARNMPQVCPKPEGRTPTTDECKACDGGDLQKCVVGVTGIEPVTSAV